MLTDLLLLIFAILLNSLEDSARLALVTSRDFDWAGLIEAFVEAEYEVFEDGSVSHTSGPSGL